MSTARNEMVKRTPAQELVSRIREDDFRQALAAALPPSVTLDKFVRVTTTALLANPDIAVDLDHASIFRALIQCASIGLLPDGKEAALVPYKGKAQLIPMVSGFRKIAAEHGWAINSAVVYENDEFDYDLVTQEITVHRAPRPGVERGKKIAAWARAVQKDGRRVIEVMDASEIAKVRAVSKASKGPWFDWEERMWEKSPVRRVFSKLPLADSDLERERIKRLLSEGELVSDAATALYGSQDRAALPAAETPVNDGRPATSAVGSTEHTGDRQQADAATQEPQTPPAAAAPAPGPPAGQDEPDIGGDGGFNAPEAVAQDEAVLAAQHASLFTIPNGKHRGIALGELLDKDGGSTWLAWALSHIQEPPEYVSALFAFSRIFAPELFQAELARREAS